MNAKFTEIHAAADFLGPGAIEVPIYQSEITDLVQRRGIFGQRIKQVPATGHPSRYFEETAIPSPSASSGFVDPRNIVAPLVTSQYVVVKFGGVVVKGAGYAHYQVLVDR